MRKNLIARHPRNFKLIAMRIQEVDREAVGEIGISRNIINPN